MDGLPLIAGRGECSALIVRTDYEHDTAWRRVVDAVSRACRLDDDDEVYAHFVDDPVWAGVTPDTVVEAARRDEYLAVVFVADTVTMESPHLALLALDLGEEDDDGDLDPEYYQELVDAPPPPRAFRTTPSAVDSVHANLNIANMDFSEFADQARSMPDEILRPHS